MRPLARRQRWVKRLKVSEEGWWMTQTTILPVLASLRRRVQTCCFWRMSK